MGKKHLPIVAEMKMADLVHLNYLLIPIIGRFGIELGFQNKTVHDVCREKEIEPSFFLEIVNSYHDSEYFAQDQLIEYSIQLIIEYLTTTHNYYLKTKIPELETIMTDFMQSSNERNKSNNQLIASFFESYKKELIQHLNQEENNLFPYSSELEEAIISKKPSALLIEKIKGRKIDHNDEAHNSLEEKLNDLKNLIIKFLPPVKRKDILEKLLFELFRLENDLNDHSRIEDKVLIPKIELLEKKVLKLGE